MNQRNIGWRIALSLLCLGAAGLALVRDVSAQAASVGTWATISPLPTGRSAPAVAAIGNRLYVAGGCCVSHVYPYTRFGVVQSLDPVSGAWSANAQMPVAVESAPSGVIDGKLYVAGGAADQLVAGSGLASSPQFQVYDPVTDSWSFKAPMPFASFSGFAGVIGGKLYVAGGRGAVSQIIGDLRIYDPATNTWGHGAPMGHPRSEGTSAVVNGVLYAIGGYDGGSAVSTVEAYDPANDMWTTLAPMPTARFYAGGASVYGRIYVVGGGTLTARELATVESYDPIANAWTSAPPMPTARLGPGVGVIGGTLYVVGGFLHDVETNVVETLSSPSPDTTPPTSMLVLAPSPNGAGWHRSAVAATVTAFDEPGGSGVQSITYSVVNGAATSGATVNGASASFTLTSEGTSAISYHASDVAGNVEAPHGATVKIDETPPTLSLPTAVTVDASSPAGAVATFTASASDALSGIGQALACSPGSGSLFPIGTSAIGCTATDIAGNVANGGFTVTVNGPAAQATNLVAAVQGMGLPSGATSSFVAQLQGVIGSLASGSTRAACNQIGAFINHAQAQAGKQLTTAQASQLIAAAGRVTMSAGCR